MYGMTDRTLINGIQTTFDTLGVTPPKTLTAAFAEADTLAKAAGGLRSEPGALEAALIDAILAGRDVSTDPKVQTAVTAQHLAANQGLAGTLEAAGFERIREACLLELDAIVKAWAKRFDLAVSSLSAIHFRIGSVPLDDTAGVLARGGDIANAWADAKNAEQTVEQILAGWSHLMQLVRVQLNADHRALRLASLSADQWRALTPKAKVWDVVCAGVSPSLPTLEEYRARIARLERDRAADLAASQPVDKDREATKAWAMKVSTARAVSA